MRYVLLLAFLLIFPTVSFSQPAIYFEEEGHDFGTLARGDRDTLEHAFVFKNTGDKELIINYLKPS